MSQIDIPPDEFDRLEELSTALADEYAGEYASVTTRDVIAFLLDLAASFEDPSRIPLDDGNGSIGDRATTDPQSTERADSADDGFPRDRLETALQKRNRKGGDTDQMDLYTIAAEYDITGRSDMAKDELIDAILAETRERYTNPFAPVDVQFPNGPTEPVSSDDLVPAGSPSETAASSTDTDDNGETDQEASTDDEATDGSKQDGDDAQLDAMLHLLDTHDDKWRKSDGDARYEVELPDGNFEPARTKDDVRALLFKYY